jgi:uncharacterized membrane protein YhaH (DUF805 family)
MNDDEGKRARDEYRRARENGRLALVLVPLLIAVTIFWVVVHPGYPTGDWRGDLVARALFGLVAVALFLAFGVLAVRRWRDAERRRRRGPR